MAKAFAVLALIAAADVQVYYDDQWVAPTKLPQIDTMTAYGLSYVSGSRTSDESRFSQSNFPLSLHWTDAHNHRWNIQLQAAQDQVTTTFPCHNEIYWYGDEKDRTGFDAQITMCRVTFSYTSSSAFQSHGIHISFDGYADDNIGYKLSGGYSEVMSDVMQGIDAAAAIAALFAEFGMSQPGAQVSYDDQWIAPTKLPQIDTMTAYGLSYVSGSRTSDESRFSQSNFPLNLMWTDAHNHRWTIQLQAAQDQVTTTFPCHNEVYWYGDEKDRTGFDAQITMCRVTFSYTSSSAFQSHGIHISFDGYADDNIGYKLSGGYSEVMKDVMQGIDAAAAIAELFGNESASLLVV